MSPTESQIARARYIRTILAHHGHNQTDLGQLLGCSQVNAGRKLRAQRRFTDDELLLIADHYGIDPANMLRPPALEQVLGAVRTSAEGLLTCTYKAFPQVTRGFFPVCDGSANLGVFPHLWAA